MKTDTYYFSHDYNARFDKKIKSLIRKHSMLGYGCYWAIIEDLYNNANALRTDYEGIAFDLRITVEQAKSIINDFELFEIEGEYFGSKSVERRLNERNEKSAKARESALNRWNKPKVDANALQTQSEGNAIKESKEKETKENESKLLLPKVTKDSLFKNEVLQSHFLEFLEMRKKIKKPMTKKAQELFKTKLEKLSNKNIQLATEIINQSILNCWQDIYELKTTQNNNGKSINNDRKISEDSINDMLTRPKFVPTYLNEAPKE